MGFLGVFETLKPGCWSVRHSAACMRALAGSCPILGAARGAGRGRLACVSRQPQCGSARKAALPGAPTEHSDPGAGSCEHVGRPFAMWTSAS